MNVPPERPYVGRLAPSPTGRLHLGHLRTFAIAWSRARLRHGTIQLRIEDVDEPRCVAGADQGIIEDLEWLGFDWDAAVVYQSQRKNRYREVLTQLTQTGLVYRCVCSRQDIKAAGGPMVEGLGRRYPGTCSQRVIPDGQAHAIRFRFEDPKDFRDHTYGLVSAEAFGGDYVLRRKDGLFAYQLAVAVDDVDAGITEIVRGADLLSSTARQLALWRRLTDRPPPESLHVPLVVSPAGTKLSKRLHSLSLDKLRHQGFSVNDFWRWVANSFALPAVESLPEFLEVYRQAPLLTTADYTETLTSGATSRGKKI